MCFWGSSFGIRGDRQRMKGEEASQAVLGCDLGEEGPPLLFSERLMSWNKKFLPVLISLFEGKGSRNVESVNWELCQTMLVRAGAPPVLSVINEVSFCRSSPTISFLGLFWFDALILCSHQMPDGPSHTKVPFGFIQSSHATYQPGTG